MCTVFWDRKGVLLNELLPRGETINAARYCETLTKLRRAIQNKRRGMLSKGIVLLHDNARPHTAGVTQSLIRHFHREQLDHPPYSPDLAPSDYHSFLYMKREFGGKRFGSDDDTKNAVESWLSKLAGSFFDDGKNASQAHKKLCAVYGDEALKERQCQNWFAKFRSGDFSLKDEKRSGRPVEVDDDLIKAIIDSDRHSTTREIAEKLRVSHTRIENHLKQLGYVQKLDTWVPHELKETHLTQRINGCDLLKKRNENDPFLKRLITGDEKWVVYNNIERKRS
ncbi:Histone-lysine N-methyltransferase SETMAR, partial [Stegodyphus mimosarum]